MAAGTASAVTAAITTAQLRLSSGNGPVERTVLVAPPRDATPIELPIIDPMEKKLEAGAAQSKWFNGYKPPKTLRLNPFESVDVRESFSWQYDPKYDESAGDLDSVPPAVAAHFHAEEFVWDSTSNLPELKEFVIAYWRACLRFARSLIRAFALSLDLPEDFFDSRAALIIES
ncbi:hypothetical protein HK405_011733 [Cladochytrium tenue]|nr:hypothetical protein HK405_011733 [Cladochytrium tenue]